MANMLQFDLVSPERRLCSVEATEVQIPAVDGEMTVMAGHAPVITTLQPGILRAVHGNTADEYLVAGGFAEINNKTMTVLAERALPVSEVTQSVFDEIVEEFRAKHSKVVEDFENEPGPVDDAARLIANMVAAGQHIGLRADKK